MKQHLMRHAVLALVCTPLLLMAATNPIVRPGLWEITTTSDLMRRARISPETVRDWKAMAEEYGIDTSQIPAGDEPSQVCITPTMASAPHPPDVHDAESGCTTRNATRSGNKFRLEFTCSSSQLKGSGTAEGTFTSAERFVGRTRFNGTAKGVPVNEAADMSGQWKSSSCGT